MIKSKTILCKDSDFDQMFNEFIVTETNLLRDYAKTVTSSCPSFYSVSILDVKHINNTHYILYQYISGHVPKIEYIGQYDKKC